VALGWALWDFHCYSGRYSAAIASKNFTIDVLLMVPDEKINSKRLWSISLRVAAQKDPVVGYNSWFAKNGAILSFLIDYRMWGTGRRMVAQMIKAGSNTAPERIETRQKFKSAST